MPEHSLIARSVKIWFINEVLKVDWFQVDGLKMWKLINFGSEGHGSGGWCWHHGPNISPCSDSLINNNFYPALVRTFVNLDKTDITFGIELNDQ